MSVTLGFPSVIVPVLSHTIAFILPMRSSASAFLMRMPYAAPIPVPTIMGVGVARPSAHGQATTKTETAATSAKENACPVKIQAAKVIIAITITIGTKTAETSSAKRCMGACEPCASSTSLIICESTVSFPTFVALNVSEPCLFMVARSEEHTSELQSQFHLVCRLLLEKNPNANLNPATPLSQLLASALVQPATAP